MNPANQPQEAACFLFAMYNHGALDMELAVGRRGVAGTTQNPIKLHRENRAPRKEVVKRESFSKYESKKRAGATTTISNIKQLLNLVLYIDDYDYGGITPAG